MPLRPPLKFSVHALARHCVCCLHNGAMPPPMAVAAEGGELLESGVGGLFPHAKIKSRRGE